jgi:hypothetical protein
MSPVREELVEPVRRSLKWLSSLRDDRGRILCPDHKIEHTGKSAYAIITACELLRLDPQRDASFLHALAVQQAHRLCDNLVREGDSPCFTFRPGRHDPFNCSNSVIDGGACSDALAHLVTSRGGHLTTADRQRFTDASLLHARTYLRYAVLDKGIPAQRAWGLTGLASAHALAPDPILESSALEAVGMLEAIQNADGSYPYHPLEWGAQHVGSTDVSAFYQSRASGFLMFALERLNRDPRNGLFSGPIVRGLDFVAALQAPDGIKCGSIEAKPWYWGAEYEVASHPFDVHALCSGWRWFGRETYARAALRAHRAWAEHLLPSGEPRSHLDGEGRGRSYQCSVFWAAHAAWIARSLETLESAARLPAETEARAGSIDLRVTWFPDCQVGRLEDGAVIAWLRGAHPLTNVHHGSPRGAGLLRVWSKSKRGDVLGRARESDEGEWTGRSGTPSPARALALNKDELRFSFWLSRVAWRGGRALEALRMPFEVARKSVSRFGAASASSAFEPTPDVELHGDGVVLRGGLAHRGGERVEGSALERSFSIDGSGLVVDEKLVAAGRAQAVSYRMPKLAQDVVTAPERASYRLS